jgi:hypothetical protein
VLVVEAGVLVVGTAVVVVATESPVVVEVVGSVEARVVEDAESVGVVEVLGVVVVPAGTLFEGLTTFGVPSSPGNGPPAASPSPP